MYFDSHAHYDDKRFKSDRKELLAVLPETVDYVINVGADMKGSLDSICLTEQYDYIYASVGVHPHEVKNMSNADIETLFNYSKHEKVVAIGEIGLDFYRDLSPRDVQKKWFKAQLELCEQVMLPVIIHSRDACQETFNIIKKSKVRNGIVHCYSGSVEMAIEYIKMGFYIGIGGVITFGNSKKLAEVVKAISIEHILIETDAPYLSPEPLRGQRNDSRTLKFIASKVAEIKGLTHDEVAKKTNENARKILLKNLWKKMLHKCYEYVNIIIENIN